MGAIAKTLVEVDGRTEEVWPLPLERDALFALFHELFDEHWDKLTWGPLIPGAAYELKCPGKPERVSLSELGYLTVHWEDLFPRLTGNALDGRDRMGKGYRKTAG